MIIDRNTPMEMLTEDRAFYILQLDQSITIEGITAHYKMLTNQYKQLKEVTRISKYSHHIS